MRDCQVDLCGAEGAGRTPEMPLLKEDSVFSFQCAGCGGCCRHREDIVLSGYDLYRLSKRLRLPPRLTARSFCRIYMGTVSHLPVLRLVPVKAEHNNCPFLAENRCAIHEARPLVCALYPLGQEISTDGQVSYYFQSTQCGGRLYQATLSDYLEGQGIKEREPLDIRWAVCCMQLEQEAPTWEADFHPVILRRFQTKLCEALYYRYDLNRPWLLQLEENLDWLREERSKLEQMQCKIHRNL